MNGKRITFLFKIKTRGRSSDQGAFMGLASAVVIPAILPWKRTVLEYQKHRVTEDGSRQEKLFSYATKVSYQLWASQEMHIKRNNSRAGNCINGATGHMY
jgi:hypothetical protein